MSHLFINMSIQSCIHCTHKTFKTRDSHVCCCCVYELMHRNFLDTSTHVLQIKKKEERRDGPFCHIPVCSLAKINDDTNYMLSIIIMFRIIIMDITINKLEYNQVRNYLFGVWYIWVDDKLLFVRTAFFVSLSSKSFLATKYCEGIINIGDDIDVLFVYWGCIRIFVLIALLSSLFKGIHSFVGSTINCILC